MDWSSLKLLFEILKGARLLIDLFAKIAVPSILIFCSVVTKTGIRQLLSKTYGAFLPSKSKFQPHTFFYQ